MSVIRRKQNKNFTVIGNEVFNDERLSLRATGLLCWLRSRPHDWNINLKHLANRWDCNRETMQKIMRELIEAGWVLREPSRTGGRGTFAGIDYVVLDEPQSVLPPEREDGSVAGSPQTENPAPVPESKKPESVEPESVEPESEKPTPYKELTLQRTRIPPNPPEDGGTASLFEQGSPEGKNAEPRPARGSLDEGPARRERRLPGNARRAPAPPVLAADTQDRYRRLEAAFPRDGVIGARYLDAQALFAALAPDDQEAAIRAADAYRAICARTGQHVKALHNWLRQGNFRNGSGPGPGNVPPGEAGAAARNQAGLAALQRGEWPAGCSEFVLAESPEGAAWEAYFARFSRGRPPLWRDTGRGLGWNMPGRRPPASEAA